MNKKVKEYIEKHTRNCSNPLYRDCIGGIVKTVYQPWLTPGEARSVAVIAREETIKEVCEWLNNHYMDYMHNPTGKQLEAFIGMDMVEDLKKHLGNKGWKRLSC